MSSVTNIIIEDLTLVPVPVWWQNPWFLALIFLLGSVAVWFALRWWRLRPRPKPEAPPVPKGPPPHLDALRRLQILRNNHSQWNAYQIAIECSDILRTYVQDRFALAIRYQTTREFLTDLGAVSGIGDEAKKTLESFLREWDRLKFCQGQASSEETLRMISETERLVRQWIPSHERTET